MMAIHLRRPRIQEKARHVDKDKLNMKLGDMHERFASKQRKPTWKGKSSDLASERKVLLNVKFSLRVSEMPEKLQEDDL